MSNSKKKGRAVDILVLSDIHLGTLGCHAKELLQYLRSIKPKIVVLNGDIIDVWQFSKRYWPKSHMKVLKQIIHWAGKGVKVYYIPGNHDELFRKFSGIKIGSISIENKIILDLKDGKKAWFFHGDVFDITMKHSKWLAKMGAIGYDTLILINRMANYFSEKILKKGKISLSKRIKNSVKGAIRFISDFETTASEIAIDNQYDFVICGHIHQPCMKWVENSKGKVQYLNSGDWIENLTSLEYANDKWEIYHYNKSDFENSDMDTDPDFSNAEIFDNLLTEFNLMRN